MSSNEVEKQAPKLNGIEKGTFVFATISERWPKILSKMVDHFHRNRRPFMEKHGESADADVKAVIHELSEMRYRLGTDKPLERLMDNFHDVTAWNKILEEMEKEPSTFTWFKQDWLFVECYLYRRMFGCLAKTKFLKDYDYFAEQKKEGFNDHLEQVKECVHFLFNSCRDGMSESEVRTDLITFLKMCLWGNQCDLSLSGGDKSSQSSLVESAGARDKYILVDDLETTVDEHLLKLGGGRQVDIVLDNSGFELMGDLFLSEFLLKHKFADRIVFHGKEIPWFVSDVIESDLQWTIDRLEQMEDELCKKAGKIWRERLDKGQFVFVAEPFWTSPHAYCDMKKFDPKLYDSLGESSFVIFKGDLNYRKLVGDRKWAYTTPFETAVRGFSPTPYLALRTLKAETICGLKEVTVTQLKKEFGERNDWMVTGEYSVAQLHN